jgi:hypothetical protein
VNAQVGGKIAQIGSRLVDGRRRSSRTISSPGFRTRSRPCGDRRGGARMRRPWPSSHRRAKTAWVRYLAIAILIGVVAYLAMRGRL